MTTTGRLDSTHTVDTPTILVDFAPDRAMDLAHELRLRGLRALPVGTPGDLEDLVRTTEAAAVVWNASATDERVRSAARQFRASAATASLPIVVAGTHEPVPVNELAGFIVSIVAPTPIERGSSPSEELLSRDAFDAGFEEHLADQPNPLGAIALLDFAERHERSGTEGSQGSGAQLSEHQEALARAVRQDAGSLEALSVDSHGRLIFLMRQRDAVWAARRLSAITAAVVKRTSGELPGTATTPVIGWTTLEPGDTVASVYERLADARTTAATRLDLRPVRRQSHQSTVPGRRTGRRRRAATVGYLVLTVLLGVVLPFIGLVVAHAYEVPAAPVLHAVVAVGLFVTSMTIWAEGWASLRQVQLPAISPDRAPPATAVIAAYLPNEATTIVETLGHFRALDYPDLQIVLAYNTPRPLPVEAEIARIAAADPRVRLLHVAGSTSKAQNINAALGVATGDFVGIFDADHHPARDSFRRAARWMTAGFDVVQGRCVIRNGAASIVARLVAVEFDAIYGVSHPGRARLHGFGIFGGSNGYWRRSCLHQIRLRDTMLTEDIDSSIRLVASGGRIASDPGLVSWELSPITWAQLWRQRLRWAQGWFQVSRRHLMSSWDNPHLARRQRMGLGLLIGWREVNPWLSQLMVPLIAFQLWHLGPEAFRTWEAGALLVSALVTATSSPAQVWFAWRGAWPDTRRRSWFATYVACTVVFYTEWRNLVARVAQMREIFGENEWTVTPRR
ncbi:MAG: glycosyltransferase [Actinomycetales bacterium]